MPSKTQTQRQIPPSLLTPEVRDHLTPEQIERIRQAYEHVHSEGTRKLYKKHWSYFETWCAAQSKPLCPKPAAPGTVIAYLTDRATQITVATLRVALSAIRSYHEDDDLISPTQHPRVRQIMKGLAVQYPRPQEQVTGIDDETFAQIIAVAHIPKEHETQKMADRRASFDIALISLMREAMLRRSEVARSEWRHIHRNNDGTFVIGVPRSKTDQTEEGRFLFISPFTIRALADMLHHRGGDAPNPEHKIFRIGDRQIANRIKAAAKYAGYEVRFGGHSPRIGMAIDLATEDTELPALAQAGRWSSPRSVARYVDKIQPSKNAVARLTNRRQLKKVDTDNLLSETLE